MDEPEIPKKKADMKNWADNDITPDLPSPGQAMGQKKAKQD